MLAQSLANFVQRIDRGNVPEMGLTQSDGDWPGLAESNSPGRKITFAVARFYWLRTQSDSFLAHSGVAHLLRHKPFKGRQQG